MLLGGEPLETLEQWVKELFLAVPSGRGPRPAFGHLSRPYTVCRCSCLMQPRNLLLRQFRLAQCVAQYVACSMSCWILLGPDHLLQCFAALCQDTLLWKGPTIGYPTARLDCSSAFGAASGTLPWKLPAAGLSVPMSTPWLCSSSLIRRAVALAS